MFKSFVAVLYLVFFSAPSSAKFYWCANYRVPSCKASQKEAAFTPSPASGSHSLRTHTGLSPLSLDKRYDHQPAFTLPSPEFSLAIRQGRPFRDYPIFASQTRTSCLIITVLRGPPVLSPRVHA